MKNYHFDVGDSKDGWIVLCASVMAESRPAAVQLLKNAFENAPTISASVRPRFTRATPASEGVVYLHLYLNLGNLKAEDIDDEGDE